MSGIPLQRRTRSILFGLVDCLFLIFASASATTVMWAVHGVGWMMPLTWLTGMVAAMAVQMLLALAAAPLLGSIETMVTSMVVAMVSPMAVCLFDLLGRELSWRESFALGAASGFLMFIVVRAYGRSCRKKFRQEFQP